MLPPIAIKLSLNCLTNSTFTLEITRPSARTFRKYIAAFIDHIEKLLPSEFNKSNWATEIKDSFIDLAAGHHKPKTPMQWIIAIADRVSSAFERQKFEDYNNEINVRDYRLTRLSPIFKEITLNKNEKQQQLIGFVIALI